MLAQLVADGSIDALVVGVKRHTGADYVEHDVLVACWHGIDDSRAVVCFLLCSCLDVVRGDVPWQLMTRTRVVLGILSSRSKICTSLDHDTCNPFAGVQLHVVYKVYLSHYVLETTRCRQICRAGEEVRFVIIRLDWCHIHPPILPFPPFRRSVDRHEPGHSFRLSTDPRKQQSTPTNCSHTAHPHLRPSPAGLRCLTHLPFPVWGHYINTSSLPVLPLFSLSPRQHQELQLQLHPPYYLRYLLNPPALIFLLIIDRFAILKPSIQRLLLAT
jgi:hypothetical protein